MRRMPARGLFLPLFGRCGFPVIVNGIKLSQGPQNCPELAGRPARHVLPFSDGQLACIKFPAFQNRNLFFARQVSRIQCFLRVRKRSGSEVDSLR